MNCQRWQSVLPSTHRARLVTAGSAAVAGVAKCLALQCFDNYVERDEREGSHTHTRTLECRTNPFQDAWRPYHSHCWHVSQML